MSEESTTTLDGRITALSKAAIPPPMFSDKSIEAVQFLIVGEDGTPTLATFPLSNNAFALTAFEASLLNQQARYTRKSGMEYSEPFTPYWEEHKLRILSGPLEGRVLEYIRFS